MLYSLTGYFFKWNFTIICSKSLNNSTTNQVYMITSLFSRTNREAIQLICDEMGHYHQCQNDFQDVFDFEGAVIKTSNDIENGECTWLSTKCVERANDEQKQIITDNYGKNGKISFFLPSSDIFGSLRLNWIVWFFWILFNKFVLNNFRSSLCRTHQKPLPWHEFAGCVQSIRIWKIRLHQIFDWKCRLWWLNENCIIQDKRFDVPSQNNQLIQSYDKKAIGIAWFNIESYLPNTFKSVLDLIFGDRKFYFSPYCSLCWKLQKCLDFKKFE